MIQEGLWTIGPTVKRTGPEVLVLKIPVIRVAPVFWHWCLGAVEGKEHRHSPLFTAGSFLSGP